MTLDELPRRYNRLAIDRTIELGNEERLKEGITRITALFAWGATKEGVIFWSEVDNAKDVSELPPIPDKFVVSKNRRLLLT